MVPLLKPRKIKQSKSYWPTWLHSYNQTSRPTGRKVYNSTILTQILIDPHKTSWNQERQYNQRVPGTSADAPGTDRVWLGTQRWSLTNLGRRRWWFWDRQIQSLWCQALSEVSPALPGYEWLPWTSPARCLEQEWWSRFLNKHSIMTNHANIKVLTFKSISCELCNLKIFFFKQDTKQDGS